MTEPNRSLSGPDDSAPQTEPVDEWPLRAEHRNERRNKRNVYGNAVVASIVAVVLTAIAVYMLRVSRTGLEGIPGLLFGCAFIAVVIAADQIRRALHAATLSSGGYWFTEWSILDAYRKYGLKEIRLATPTIRRENADAESEGYHVARNGFTALWIGSNVADDGAVRSYALWWRDHDWPDLKREKIKGMEVFDSASGESSPADNADETRECMELLHRQRGVDLRMWPCVLEVRGDRGRLLFDPNAEKVWYGPRDPLIEKGVDMDADVYHLR